jgi:hypothetical protein
MAKMPTIRWNRRAFWVTVALFGTMNAAHYVYFWSLPIKPIHSKHEVRLGRIEPDWLGRAVIGLNIPGCYVAGAVLFAAGSDSQAGFVGLSELFGSLFWAFIAALVVGPAKRRIPIPNAEPESNLPPAP